MIFDLNKKNDSKLAEHYNISVMELSKFFELDFRPNVIIVPDRNAVDEIRNEKTESWIVGWSRGNIAYLIAEENSNRTEKQYYQLLKHELCHCFQQQIFNLKTQPRWLFEGLALYLADQYNPEKSELSDFLSNETKAVYRESGNAVKLLLEKYGKEKLFEFMNTGDFEKTYNSKLNYEFFNKKR